jgi:transcriptional regulator with XRE-family HTH domain
MDQGFSEKLQRLGSMMRAARVARGLTQQHLAKGAKVSRAQLSDFENGANVSILFLLKIAHFLDLKNVPLDGVVELSAAASGVDVLHLLRLLDVLSSTVDEVRMGVIDAVLPPSEHRELGDAQAMKAFLTKHLDDDRGLDRLAEALVGATDKPRTRQPKTPSQAPTRARRTRKTGA